MDDGEWPWNHPVLRFVGVSNHAMPDPVGPDDRPGMPGVAVGTKGSAWGMGTTTGVAVTGNWRVHSACRDDPDGLFVQGAAQRKAKQVCVPCPVRARCLAEALDRRIEFGVWGGMTERERRALLRRRPDVRNWHVVLERSDSPDARAG